VAKDNKAVVTFWYKDAPDPYIRTTFEEKELDIQFKKHLYSTSDNLEIKFLDSRHNIVRYTPPKSKGDTIKELKAKIVELEAEIKELKTKKGGKK